MRPGAAWSYVELCDFMCQLIVLNSKSGVILKGHFDGQVFHMKRWLSLP